MEAAKGWALSGLLLAAAAALPRLKPGGVLPPIERPAMAEYAVQDLSMALAGLRRFGGDMAFLQMLQYLAGSEGMESGHDHEHEHGAGTAHSHAAWLPDLLPLSLRVAVLSPYFHAAYLFSAGCLGFVLDRPGEAVALLEVGARHDPSYWRYRIYAAAIAYRGSAEPEKAIPFLEEALKYPDCPSLLQNILANLHKKQGNYRRAAQIYEFTLKTSRDPAAVDTAQRALERLREEGRVP